MDQNTPGSPISSVPPVQPNSSVPPSQPIPANYSGQQMEQPIDMAAKRKTELKITTGVLLAFVVGLVLSGVYFTKIKPQSSTPKNAPVPQITLTPQQLSRKSPPRVDNKFQPIPALTALLNCGVTPDAQKVLDQDFIINAGTTLGIEGTIMDIKYPSTTEASLTLQKRNHNDTITLPIKTENDGIIKNAKIVYNPKTKLNDLTITSLQKGNPVTVTLLCRTSREVNTKLPNTTLTTLSIR